MTIPLLFSTGVMVYFTCRQGHRTDGLISPPKDNWWFIGAQSVLQTWKLIFRLFFLSPQYNVGRFLQVLLSPVNIDLGGGGGGGGVENKIVRDMRNEKYIICLEIFNNLSLT